MQQDAITVEASIQAPIDKVWDYWTQPEHIVHWAFASDDWEAPSAENDVQVGGRFKTVMAAKDKSAAFDFTGTYTAVKAQQLIEYDMDGDENRHVKITFVDTPDGTKVTTVFDPEHENPLEMQKVGWQGIQDNFKKYVESN